MKTDSDTIKPRVRYLNNEPTTLLGYTHTELMKSALFCMGLAIILVAFVFVLTFDIKAALIIGIGSFLASLIYIGQLLEDIKRQRPDGYYTQWMLRKTSALFDKPHNTPVYVPENTRWDFRRTHRSKSHH